tara:strand:- start:357 stop:773 length:417 start_codon:yes stop_codon:yes gene_type:complete
MSSYFLFANNTTEIHDLWYESHASILKMVAMECGATNKIPELLVKYLGKKVKMKAPKDPDRPKRPMTAFMYFCNKYRPNLIKKARKTGKVNIGAIAKALGKLWAKQTDLQKKPFQELAVKAKEDYEHRINEYNEKNGL